MLKLSRYEVLLVSLITLSAVSHIMLFFIANTYEESDLYRSSLRVKSGMFNDFMMGVRPALPIIAFLSPLDPRLTLSIASLVAYVLIIVLSFKFVKKLYGKESAFYATYFS